MDNCNNFKHELFTLYQTKIKKVVGNLNCVTPAWILVKSFQTQKIRK